MNFYATIWFFFLILKDCYTFEYNSLQSGLPFEAVGGENKVVQMTNPHHKDTVAVEFIITC